MSLPIFSFIFAMWILIIIGGGLMVVFVGPLSFSGYGDFDESFDTDVTEGWQHIISDLSG